MRVSLDEYRLRNAMAKLCKPTRLPKTLSEASSKRLFILRHLRGLTRATSVDISNAVDLGIEYVQSAVHSLRKSGYVSMEGKVKSKLTGHMLNQVAITPAGVDWLAKNVGLLDVPPPE